MAAIIATLLMSLASVGVALVLGATVRDEIQKRRQATRAQTLLAQAAAGAPVSESTLLEIYNSIPPERYDQGMAELFRAALRPTIQRLAITDQNLPRDADLIGYEYVHRHPDYQPWDFQVFAEALETSIAALAPTIEDIRGTADIFSREILSAFEGIEPVAFEQFDPFPELKDSSIREVDFSLLQAESTSRLRVQVTSLLDDEEILTLVMWDPHTAESEYRRWKVREGRLVPAEAVQ